jgi:hypothetical protein
VAIRVQVEASRVPKEEATEETFGPMKEWYGDRQLAVGHHRKLKKQTQGDCESQKKLVTTCNHMIIPARHQGR